MKAFPKNVHVVREDEGTEDEWLSIAGEGTAEDALLKAALTESEPKRIAVATYQLVEVKEGQIEGVFSAIVG